VAPAAVARERPERLNAAGLALIPGGSELAATLRTAAGAGRAAAADRLVKAAAAEAARLNAKANTYNTKAVPLELDVRTNDLYRPSAVRRLLNPEPRPRTGPARPKGLTARPMAVSKAPSETVAAPEAQAAMAALIPDWTDPRENLKESMAQLAEARERSESTIHLLRSRVRSLPPSVAAAAVAASSRAAAALDAAATPPDAPPGGGGRGTRAAVAPGAAKDDPGAAAGGDGAPPRPKAEQAGIEFLKDLLSGNPDAVEALRTDLAQQAATAGMAEAEKRALQAAGRLPLERIRPEDLKVIGGFTNDIARQAIEARARVLEFWTDLLQAQLDLNQENARHSQSMLAVAQYELKRWVLLGDLNADYASVYGPATAVPAPGEPEKVPLFATTPDLEKWEATVNDEATNAAEPLRRNRRPFRATTQPVVLLHPPIARDDRILPSIRRLGETARAWHAADQSTADPLGRHHAAGNERLYAAVRTVQGHLLMVSLNRHMAGENTVRLTTELAAHNNHLDSLRARVQEAGYRLVLSDLQAFHNTGITEADLQAIGDAALFYIGYGVRK